MSTIYIKTNYSNIICHIDLRKDIRINKLAPRYNRTPPSTEYLYAISSELFTIDQLTTKFDGIWNPQQLQGAIIDKIAAHLWGIYLENGQEPQGETFRLLDLSEAKEIKFVEIDAKTVSVIDEGYHYQTGVTFSMSEVSQINWTNLFMIRSTLTYPFRVSTIDNGQYEVQDATEMQNIYFGGLTYKNSILEGGRDLKVLVHAATTIQQVNDIADAR